MFSKFNRRGKVSYINVAIRSGYILVIFHAQTSKHNWYNKLFTSQYFPKFFSYIVFTERVFEGK